MARILVIPERLIDLSRHISQSAAQLREMESRLGQTLGRLDWETRRRTGVEAQVHAVCRRASDLADQAERLARYLLERAQAFREADEAGAQAIRSLRGLLASLRPTSTLLAQLDTLLDYMSAGRTNMQRFLDLIGVRRYGSAAPLLKIGVLDQRYKFSKTVGKIGVGIGIFSDILNAEDVDERTIGVAVIRNVGEYTVGGAVPWVGIALAGNALVQLTGRGIVLVSRNSIPVLATNDAMETDLRISAGRVEDAFERADLGRITEDIGELVYDIAIGPRVNALRSAWQQPSIRNVMRLLGCLSPMPVPSPGYYTPDEREQIVGDLREIAEDAFDFAKGVPDLGFTLIEHVVGVMGPALVAKRTSQLPVPSEWKETVNQACEQVIDYVVSHPLTVDDLFSVPESLPSGYPDGTSWLNSVQFAPVVGAGN